MKTGLLSTTAIVLALATGPALAQSSGSDTQDMQQENQNQDTTTGQTQNQDSTTGQTQNKSTTTEEQGSTMGQDEGSTTGSTTPSQSGDTAATGGMSGETFIAEQDPNAILADELIGTTVRTTDGESVGDVQDLLVNENSGVEAILIGVGGFLGMGEKTVAINYEQVQRTRTEDGTLELVLTTDRAALENAPEFTSREQQQAQQAQ